MASTVTSTNNLSLRSILEKDKLTGSNFLDWECNLMIVLRHERKWYVLEEPLREAPPATAPAAARNAHKKHSDDLLDVACLMLATMSPDLQAGFINTKAYDMIRQLRDMFQTQARTERYDATKAFNECKMVKGTSVSDHVMKMKRHLGHLERLGHPVPLQLATDTILNSLSEDYMPFVVNYNMNNMEKSIAELHSMFKTAELNMGNKNKTKDVLMVRDGGVKKKNGHTSTSKGKGPVQAVQSAPKKGKGKGKGKKVKPNKARTENRCFTCNEVGHWRQNCPKRHEAVLLKEQFVGRLLVDQFSSNPVGQTKVVYKHDGEMLMLTDDEDVSAFMEFAGNSSKPPTLFVDVDYSMCDGGGTSNTTIQEGANESQIDMSTRHNYNNNNKDNNKLLMKKKIVQPIGDVLTTHVFNLSFAGITLDDDEEDDEEDDDEEDDEGVTLRAGVNDYFEMPVFVPTQKSLRRQTKQYLTIVVQGSSKTRYEVLCINSGCAWRMTARMVGDNGMFHVRFFNDVHTCSRTQLNSNHRQANKKVLGALEKILRANRTYQPRDIVDDINQQFGLSIGYATGWRARWDALDSIRGSPSESFTRLPVNMYNLELTNPGTQTSIRVDTDGRFEECFVALGVAIHTFLQNLRRVLIIDVAHLKGPYLGTMFLVVAMDGNNNIVPIAFGVGKSETADEWTWFLSKLKRCIGEPEGLVFMSDRAASINAAITTIFPNSHHALCCRHLVMNVRSRDSRIKVFKTPYWKACKAYTTYVFDRMMNILRVAIPDGARLIEEVGVERWLRVYFPGIRYNIMTSNSAESINAMSRFARRLPIVGLIEYFRAFQQEWYFIRRAKADSLDHPLTEWAQHKLWKRVGKSATWTVRGIGYNVWEVHDGGRNANMDMHQHSCECRQWQLSGLPCGHAIAVAKKTKIRDVYSLVDVPYFKAKNYKATYIGVIKPVGPPETWQFPDTPLQSVRPPIIKKRRVERPNVNARRPSRGEGNSLRRCPRCGDHGHKSDTCPLFPASASGSSQRSMLEPHGTIRSDSLYQDFQFN
ncbi:hypothetical protein OSB04_010275 [Centaurea solstitialis]|uniref:SWIM-type domain-containing protein n=1 Tax=Centaurea solstitialis TaxID=347529 RepID=A0AA38TKF6_9ASTR|nr:hypothetical protein OSB04_010275 [Centaurea solstitialis]